MQNPHKLISLFTALLLIGAPVNAFADTDNGGTEIYAQSLIHI